MLLSATPALSFLSIHGHVESAAAPLLPEEPYPRTLCTALALLGKCRLGSYLLFQLSRL
jgi:hypothetical protein